ncbi:hypothetical protein HMPREF1531_00431 [Propionibacterium sp. oral taxon 192 str. F0372]|uniref:hypothetical protein n=1 Tax=Propionibacterium sp. oral taxon 192 TaxID=671222 RepID=UPI0003538F6F|nr:hypothetical protein [Propionibacterium sp. oral taxon 192]EPH06829.1 hypothetical protein HMPREF1531_00431 [Propionibacterium sp. oral taxon 192 str. F0372]
MSAYKEKNRCHTSLGRQRRTGRSRTLHYLELKAAPDPVTEVNKSKVAKFIFGVANWLPDRATEAFEGYGVMIVDIAKEGIEGIPLIELFALTQVIPDPGNPAVLWCARPPLGRRAGSGGRLAESGVGHPR